MVSKSLSCKEVILAGRLAYRLGSSKYGRALFRHARSLEPENPEVRYYTRQLKRRESFYETLARHEREPLLGSDNKDLEAFWCIDQAWSLAYVRDFKKAFEILSLARSFGSLISELLTFW